MGQEATAKLLKAQTRTNQGSVTPGEPISPDKQNAPPVNGASNTGGGAFTKYLTTMIAQPIQTKQLSADGYQWNQYSPRVATITNELTHFAQVAYFAFEDWEKAHAFWKSITDKQVCSRAQVREAERFTSHSWEVKVWAMSVATLEQLIERDAARGGSLCDHRNRLPKALPLPQIKRDWSLSDSHSAIAIKPYELRGFDLFRRSYW